MKTGVRVLSVMLALVPSLLPWQSHACCAVVAIRGHVVNADQSVIMIWDKESHTQHFIRKANFKSDTADVGFLVPSPSRPTLDESGDKAFNTLEFITAPVTYSFSGGFPLGCSVAQPVPIRSSVKVIEEKRVAGYDATVLTARSGKDLVEWLEKNGYPYSPAVADWAAPYLTGNWHFTALKIIKEPKAKAAAELKAASLRISFKTDRPLFPYREPDSAASSRSLGAKDRLLRIYFIAETQYQARINGNPWSGKPVWSGDITSSKPDLLDQLGLPRTTGPSTWWLTEFEDHWPYAKAAGDVYFSPVEQPQPFTRNGQMPVRRVPFDASAVLMLLVGSYLIRKPRRWDHTARLSNPVEEKTEKLKC